MNLTLIGSFICSTMGLAAVLYKGNLLGCLLGIYLIFIGLIGALVSVVRLDQQSIDSLTSVFVVMLTMMSLLIYMIQVLIRVFRQNGRIDVAEVSTKDDLR